MSAAADDVVRVRGSSTFLHLVRSVAEDHMSRHANVRVTVAGGGSSRGYKALLDGTADLAFISGPIPEPLKAEAQRRGIALRLTTVGYQVLVAAVHPSQATEGVTLAELRAIFTGRLAQWPASHRPIQVFVGRPTGGLTLDWIDLVLKDDDTLTPKATVMTEDERARVLAQTADGISYLPLHTASAAKLKTLLIDGMAPTAAQVRRGSYPLRAELVLVTRDNPSAATAALVRTLASPQPGAHLDGMVMLPPTAQAQP